MDIRNVGILVKDLEGARKFFEDYFGAKILKTINNEDTGYYSYVLELSGHGWIELISKPGMVDKGQDINRLGIIHVCIGTDTREELDAIVQKLKDDGYYIQYEPSNPEGTGEVRAVTFEDIVIEAHYEAE